ncbi:hypothetical protein SH501x_002204 [Pirellulaceae bacterium SH501]
MALAYPGLIAEVLSGQIVSPTAAGDYAPTKAEAKLVPHFAFQGQTPDEIVFGTGANVPVDLKEKRAAARTARIAHNRALSCDQCKARESEPALVSLQNNTS